MWIKNSDGDKSATVTLMWIAFIVTTIAYIAGMFVQIGPVVFRQFDVGAASTYFIPILTLYGGRRWTNAKYSVNNGGLSQEYTSTNEPKEG